MLESLTREVRHVVYRLSGEFSHLKPGTRCHHQWYGNTYGGFYACPDLLNANSIVYSFGIGEDISFDEAIMKRHGCHVFAFDPTPKSIAWVQKQDVPATFHFSGVGISDKSGPVSFYLPRNPEHVSGSMIPQENVSAERKVSVPMRSITDIMTELGHTRLDVVKMDIEGAEYDVLADLVQKGIPITQILVEFHDRFLENGKQKTQDAVAMLRRNGYEIFACSKTFQEISFIRRQAVVI